MGTQEKLEFFVQKPKIGERKIFLWVKTTPEGQSESD